MRRRYGQGRPHPQPPSFRRGSFLRSRIVWHTLGLATAVALGWLAWRGYRQPAFLLDLANAFLLC